MRPHAERTGSSLGGRRLRRLALPGLVGLVALGAGLASSFLRSTEDGGASSVALAREPARYTLVYRSEQALARAGAQLAGRLDLDLDVELRPRGEHVGLAVVTCRRFEWQALGSPVIAGDPCPTLLDTESLAIAEDDGALREVRTDPALDEALAHLHLGLWQELAFTRRDDDRYAAIERTPRGLAHAELTRSESPEGLVFERRRHRYEATPSGIRAPGELVRGQSTLTLRDGSIAQLEVDERLEGDGHVEVHLALSRLGDAPPPPPLELARLIARRPDDVDPDRDARLLERRAAGLTIADLTEQLARFGDAGRVPDHERFLWRATGLLRLHPELAFALEPLFLDGDASSSRRGLVLDLLVHARTAESQQALRRLLASETAHDDPRHALHVQRLALLEAPDAATVSFATDRFEQATTVVDRFAAAYTYAGVARQSGDAVVAREAARALGAELERAEDPTERLHWLRALGATAAPEARAAIVRHVSDSSPNVRVAAVDALARQPGDGSELRGALSDGHEAVQREALRHVALDERDLEALHALARSDGWRPRNVEPLVRRLAHARATHPEAVRAVALALIDAGHARGELAPVLHALAS